MSEKRAPVQGFSAGIPWAMHLRAYDAYCRKHGAQPALIDLEGRGCRGGFSHRELDEFIPGWREELSELASARSTIAEQKKRIAELEAERDNWERTAVSAEGQLIGAEANAKRIAELEAVQFTPAGDNHHNALKCPYCNPKQIDPNTERQRREEAEGALREWEEWGDYPYRNTKDLDYNPSRAYFLKHNPPTTPGATQ